MKPPIIEEAERQLEAWKAHGWGDPPFGSFWLIGRGVLVSIFEHGVSITKERHDEIRAKQKAAGIPRVEADAQILNLPAFVDLTTDLEDCSIRLSVCDRMADAFVSLIDNPRVNHTLQPALDAQEKRLDDQARTA